MNEEKKIHNLDDLVFLALRPYGQEHRYELNINSHREWNDQQIGEEWQNKERKLAKTSSSPYWDDPVYREHKNLKPSEHLITTYYLYRNTSSWHGESIYLTEELGKQLDSVWTKKEKYGRQARVGVLTLTGILKRLGQTDISKQIKEVKQKQEEKDKRDTRNQYRKSISSKLEELNKAVASAINNGVVVPQIDFSIWEESLKLEGGKEDEATK